MSERKRFAYRLRTSNCASRFLVAAVSFSLLLGPCFPVVAEDSDSATNRLLVSAADTNAATTTNQSTAASPDAPSAEKSAADDPDMSLEKLLDLADKDPQSLQSIGVRPSQDSLLTKPDQVFRPDDRGGVMANSTGELLSREFGVVTRTTSAINQDARVRGFSGSQIVGIANGMNPGRTRIDVDSLFSQIDPNLISSITVTSGPYAVEYGPGFAFFDAQLLAPGRSDSLKMTSDTRIGFNTNGRQLTWRETIGFSDRSSGALISTGQRMGSAYRPGAGSNDFNIPAAFHEQDVYAALSMDVTSRSRLDGSFLHQNLVDTQLPGVSYDINNQNADQFNARWTWFDDDADRDRLLVQYWWGQAEYNGDASRASKQQTFFTTLITQPYPQLTDGNIIINGFSTTSGARANLLWGDNDRWEGKTGIDWRRSSQLHHETFIGAGNVNPLGTDILGIPFASSNDFGIFTGGTLKATDQWKFNAGQRLDFVTYGISTSDIAATSIQFTPGSSVTGFNTPTRWLNTTYLTSTYQIDEELSVNGGAAFAMRPPNTAELYSNSPSAPLVRFGNSFVYGDSTLNSEKNLQFDLGATKRMETMLFGVRGFHSEIFDYIGLGATNWGYFPEIGTSPNGTLGRGQPYMANPFIPNPNLTADSASLGYIYRNIDRVSMSGIEFQGEQRILPWFELFETIGYTRATNHDPAWVDIVTGQVHHLGGTEGVPGIYPMNGMTAARIVEPINRKWFVEWQSRFARRQDYLAHSLGEIGTPGFVVHNINGSYKLSDHISFRASVLNVLNTNYYEHTSLAIVDRSGSITFVKNPGISLFTGVECSF